MYLKRIFRHLVNFKWIACKWYYKMIVECPRSVSVKNMQENRKPLQRFKVYHAETILGVEIAPDGNNHEQGQKIYEIAVKWADGMHTGRIS